ncbi:MAG: hypothetical protein Q7V01_03615 [Vicinamibacterales bacterium]|nr:hypothetical protein [Vicinamibacterales bacterium]
MHRAIRAVLVLGAMAVAVAANAGLPDFQGRWKNVDAKTKGLTTLEITVTGTKAMVHAWGSCVPSDCDMGEWPATIYASRVDEDLARGAKAMLVAVGKTTTFVITKGEDGTLRCDVFSQFTDNSGRSNSLNSYLLRLSPIQPRKK